MESLARREAYSYGCGEVASNVAWNMATGFLAIYYTDVALLPALAVGTLMLVTRLLDAVFDPLAGYLVDRTRSRFGRARPYLLYAGVPFAVLFAASFSVPAGASVAMKLVFAYITFTLTGLAYSLLYVPYSAMLPMMTRNEGEKMRLGSFRAMGSSLASIFAYGAAMPMIAHFGGDDRQWGYTVTAAIMGLASAVLFWIVFANCKERLTLPIGAERPVFESLGKLFRNPIWTTAFLMALTMFVKIGVMVGSLAFFTKDVMGNPGLVGTILSLMSLAILAGGFTGRYLIGAFGFVRTNIVATVIQSMMVLTLGMFETQPTAFAAIFILSNIATGIFAASNFRLGADAVEWHERWFGHRDEGMNSAGLSFAMKVGMAVGSAFTVYALGFSGYDPQHANTGANVALRTLTYGAPLVFNLAIIALWLRMKRLQAEPVAARP